MKRILIQDQIFHRQTLVIYSDSKEFAENAFKEAFSDDIPEGLSSFYGDNLAISGRTILENNVVIVLLRYNNLGVLVHELFHAVEFHLEYLDIPHSDDTSEVWAYYQEFLVNNLTTIFE